MDTLRGNFGSFDETTDDEDYGEDDISREAPPSPVGQDERRMQVRAYNHWASLLQDRNFPSVEDLDPDALPDFGPYSVLLDFTSGIENPAVQFLGGSLASECGAEGAIETLDDVPSRSLLSRITDHYMQILANQAPIGFEAEFINQRGATILYRGILLPFSSDDDTIDFIYGVINWKETADQLTTDELLLEIDQALEEQDEEVPLRGAGPVTDWADGPAGQAASANDDQVPSAEELADLPFAEERDEVVASAGHDFEDVTEDDEDGDGDGDGDIDSEFGNSLGLTGLRNKPNKKPLDLSSPENLEPVAEVEDDAMPMPAFGMEKNRFSGLLTPGYSDESDDPDSAEFDEDEWPAPITEQISAVMPPAVEESAVAEEKPADNIASAVTLGESADEPGLYDCLASARELAHAARSSEDRSRSALYAAVGEAYDFSLLAEEAPEDFDELVAENGLIVQDRAPMTPIVKLVFGADYDKTRLTEYAAVLSHAHRVGLDRGQLAGFLSSAEGGLKGVVQAERRLRREEAGKPAHPVDGPREALAKKLRAIEPRSLNDLDAEGAEFGLVMIRRLENGEIVVLGEISDDIPLIERVGRKLVG